MVADKKYLYHETQFMYLQLNTHIHLNYNLFYKLYIHIRGAHFTNEPLLVIQFDGNLAWLEYSNC